MALNKKQREILEIFLKNHEATFKVENWEDFKGIHSSFIETIYKELLKYENKS